MLNRLLSSPWPFAVGMTGFALFNMSAALGAPVGRFTMGGRHRGSLPRPMRPVAAGSAALCLGFSVAALGYVGRTRILGPGTSRTVLRGASVYLALNTVANAASPSRHERLVMTPASAILAILAAGLVSFGQGQRE